jgi:TRAP-type C4-dicarboxylate transport system permease small subunit
LSTVEAKENVCLSRRILDQIFYLALLLFAVVVLPATWYYSKKSGKLPTKNKPFISDLEKTRKQYTQHNFIALAIIVVMFLLIIFLVDHGVI